MDAKITLRFNEDVINKGKRYAEKNNISLSRLVEFLLQKTTSSNYQSLEDFPISKWVSQVAEGEAVYQTKKEPAKHQNLNIFLQRNNMRIFLDANILVAVINKEYPLFTYASRIISLADNKQYEVYTSPLCLAIAFYFAGKKNKKTAKQKIKLLGSNLSIASVDDDCMQKTLQNASVDDFEDGLEYYAAAESKCKCIITEDKNDFYFSDIEVLNSGEFFNKYLVKRV